ncbi:DNA-processing protein DprA [Rubrimonas sp.]|uniref:DNA-processing protein DprA n=1 Tax=Rubrimonas sp. TaxID=2036015 RepID=UPI002FDEB36F
MAALRLARSRNVGPRTFARLMARFGDAEAALDALPEIAAGAGLKGVEAFPEADALREIEAGARVGARFLIVGNAGYPAALAEIPDPPPVLWALGDPALAARPCVAVVGARNASASGRRMAGMLARGLGAQDFAVVSGLARGIDAAAHEAALETGTVAVLASGVDVIYPPEHDALAARIAEAGLILSEAAMGEAPTARAFPRRNRIVSGLSAGVVLVEAAERSGSLITARMALEQGREAMAVPGSPLDPRAAGCNALIREGAALIRSTEDVVEALGAPASRAPAARSAAAPARPVPAPAAAPAASGSALLDLLGSAPVAFDALAEASGLGARELSAALLDLELEGTVTRLPGDLFARAPSPR